MFRGAIIALEANDFRAREIRFKAQNIIDLSPAPSIDRLVIIADNADIIGALREEPEPEILRDICVLILIDQNIAKFGMIAFQDIWVVLKQRQIMQQ